MREVGGVRSGESASGSRRTRSNTQAGPVWTVQDTLILVNEIAAVEGDCQNALSSYQKWNIIAETCTALDVARNATQCRRKWESLLDDYNLVKDWELNSEGDSYWSLGSERKQEIGLPVDFDNDLYTSIDNFMDMKVNEGAETDPECDTEDEAAEVDLLETEEFGFKQKRVRRRSTSHRKFTNRQKPRQSEVRSQKPVPNFGNMANIMAIKPVATKKSGSRSKRPKHQSLKKSFTNERKQMVFEEQPEELMVEEQANEPVPLVDEQHEEPAPISEEHHEEPMIVVEKHDEEAVPAVEEHQGEPVPVEEEHHEESTPVAEEQHIKPVPVLEDLKQTLASQVQEKAELVQSIVATDNDDSVEEELSDIMDEETLKTLRARFKADKLIACLTDLTKNLEQLHDVVM